MILLPDVHQLVEQHVVAHVRAASGRAGSSARCCRCARTSPSAIAGSESRRRRVRARAAAASSRRRGSSTALASSRRSARSPARRRRRHARRPCDRHRATWQPRRVDSTAMRTGSPPSRIVRAVLPAAARRARSRTRLRSRAIHFSCLRTNCSASRREPPRGTVTRSVPSGRTRRM